MDTGNSRLCKWLTRDPLLSGNETDISFLVGNLHKCSHTELFINSPFVSLFLKSHMSYFKRICLIFKNCTSYQAILSSFPSDLLMISHQLEIKEIGWFRSAAWSSLELTRHFRLETPPPMPRWWDGQGEWPNFSPSKMACFHCTPELLA